MTAGPNASNRTKVMEPNTNKIAQRQLKAYESVFGKGTLDKMGQYASGTIEASDLPFEGTINLLKIDVQGYEIKIFMVKIKKKFNLQLFCRFSIILHNIF